MIADLNWLNWIAGPPTQYNLLISQNPETDQEAPQNDGK